MPATPLLRRPAALVVVLALALGAVVTSVPRAALADLPVPTVPVTLPAGIEAQQPYVGQSTCDPVAKPGVVAWSKLLLATYPSTSSIRITEDCGVDEVSEHKEGRAFDWGVSAFDPAQKAIADNLIAWLLAKDAAGNDFAMARRLGIMYIIWNGQMWRAYRPQDGWQPYTGSVPHTDHVHFSFGWNGARGVTSFWTGKVAPVDLGPTGPGNVDPVRSPANLRTVASYGSTTLQLGSTGAAVKVVQSALRVNADGSFASSTDAAVRAFQQHVSLPVTGVFGPTEWRTLFPPPVLPFGSVDEVADGATATRVRGWALDADSPSGAPIVVHVYVDGAPVTAVVAGGGRPDVGATFPGVGDAHGYDVSLPLEDGKHTVCVYGINVGAGSNALIGCTPVTVTHDPRGFVDGWDVVPGTATARGWTLDPDSTAATTISLQSGTTTVATATADGSRPDVALQYPAWGPSHGYTLSGSLAALPEGAAKLCATARNVARGADRSLGCTSTVVRHQPFGSFDAADVLPGALQVSGWAVEPDAPAPAQVRVLVDGVVQQAVTASGSRPDVGRVFPFYGAAHGLALTLPLPAAEGSHSVCLTAVDTGPGTDASLGCRTVTVSHRPFGSFDTATTDGAGSVTVSGWAVDPDTAGAIAVHTWVDGAPVAALPADGWRPDVAAVFPAFGARHGFSATLPPLAPGRHTVCTYALNAEAGTDNPLLGCKAVTAP